MTAEEQGRLARLTEDLAKNPTAAAAEQRVRANRIKHLTQTLSVIAEGTGESAIASLLALHDDAVSKRAAARLTAQGLFGTAALPNVGGEVWRTLWDAARRYSEEVAYPEARFPPSRPDMLCVLCHQRLSADAVERMGSFEAFVRNDTEQHALAAEEALAAAAFTAQAPTT